MKKEHDVRKHNSLINLRTKHKYNVNELKFICKQISMIRPDYKNFEDEVIHIQDLGFSSKEIGNYKYIRKFFEDLYSKSFYLPGTNRLCGWFSSLEYKDGYIYYSMDEKLIPFLLDVQNNFTQYHVSNVLKLRSSYSIRIYELLKQLEDKGNRTFIIEDLRSLLDIPEKYKNGHIKSDILDKAKKDLQKNTDLSFTYEFIKQGRSFNSIKFKIFKNKKIEEIDTTRVYGNIAKVDESKKSIFKFSQALHKTNKINY